MIRRNFEVEHYFIFKDRIKFEIQLKNVFAIDLFSEERKINIDLKKFIKYAVEFFMCFKESVSLL